VRSTSFLFTTLCTSIQYFGVLRVQIGVQWNKFKPAGAAPRRRAPTRTTPAQRHPWCSGPRAPSWGHAPRGHRAPRVVPGGCAHSVLRPARSVLGPLALLYKARAHAAYKGTLAPPRACMPPPPRLVPSPATSRVPPLSCSATRVRLRANTPAPPPLRTSALARTHWPSLPHPSPGLEP
jgi:hypothetical protein